MTENAQFSPENWAVIFQRHRLLEKLKPWLTATAVLVLVIMAGIAWRGADVLGPALEEMGIDLPMVTIIALSPVFPIALLLLALAVAVKDTLFKNPVVTLALNFLALCLAWVLLTVYVTSLFLPFIAVMREL